MKIEGELTMHMRHAGPKDAEPEEYSTRVAGVWFVTRVYAKSTYVYRVLAFDPEGEQRLLALERTPEPETQMGGQPQ